MRQYHLLRGDTKRTRVIVPDSAHGTNPASAAVCGLEIVEVKSTADGTVDTNDLKGLLDDTIAGIMMPNPNTLGIYETQVVEIACPPVPNTKSVSAPCATPSLPVNRNSSITPVVLTNSTAATKKHNCC